MGDEMLQALIRGGIVEGQPGFHRLAGFSGNVVWEGTN